ncbi:MAG TPA: hypothetical protein VJ672_02805 [Gemmatimonadaceae bacterium]|nr:hypothetical protein [Gemmatimonadaceae bacterium]
MKRSLLSFAAVVLLAAPVGAQTVGATNPGGVYFRLFGGATLPTGDFGDVFDTGWRGGGTVGWQLAGIPVGFDVDVAYDRVGGGTVGPFEVDDLGIISGTANVRWDYQGEGPIGFYVAGGGGIYNFQAYDVSGPISVADGLGQRLRLGGGTGTVEVESETKFGLNGGAGLMFGRSNTRFFVEARYHTVFTDDENANFIPIVLGVQFGPPR